MRQLALIGLSPSAREAPISDDAWETWGLGADPRCHLYDRVFEMHPPELFDGEKRARVERQRAELPDLITQETYPWAFVSEVWPHGYDSSPAYMLALALAEHCSGRRKWIARLGIWGVDQAADDEYAYQRDNFIRLIGFCEGEGLAVELPAQSKLRLPVRRYPFGFEHMIGRT